MKIFELVISVISASVFIYLAKIAFDMPDYRNFWTGPGAFPFVISSLLAVFSLWWAVDLLLQKRTKQAGDDDRRPALDVAAVVAGALSSKELHRLLIIGTLTVLYIFVLTPNMEFPLATFLYLAASIGIFGGMHWAKSLAAAAVISGIVWSVFTYVLHLPMP